MRATYHFDHWLCTTAFELCPVRVRPSRGERGCTHDPRRIAERGGADRREGADAGDAGRGGERASDGVEKQVPRRLHETFADEKHARVDDSRDLAKGAAEPFTGFAARAARQLVAFVRERRDRLAVDHAGTVTQLLSISHG
jgi:hypothetical protein